VCVEIEMRTGSPVIRAESVDRDERRYCPVVREESLNRDRD
jgi:hypothetical protein